ncbi:MAG: hypothetical protein AAGB07_05450 [Pseudomonadota bacterium]
MRKKPGTKQGHVAKTAKDIRRTTPKQYAAEQKNADLTAEREISELPLN